MSGNSYDPENMGQAKASIKLKLCNAETGKGEKMYGKYC
jgi:hypothetical protein